MTVNEREIALFIFDDILQHKEFNHLALKRAFNLRPLDKRKKAFITELVYQSLRRLFYLDYVIDHYHIKKKKMKPFILNLLRLSVYQLYFMDKVPSYAVIDEAVKICKRSPYQSLSSFVNAILRNISKNPPLPILTDSHLEKLSIEYSVPLFLVDRWISAYGKDAAVAMLEEFQHASPFFISANRYQSLEGSEKSFEKHQSTLPYIFRGQPEMIDSRSFKQGEFFHIDWSSAYAIHCLKPAPKDVILDLCAAPGGKTFYAAQWMNYEGKIIARDIHPKKIETMKKEALKLGISFIEAQMGDATVYDESLYEKFDKVIVDCPCTGFGLIGKKPDIRYRRKEEDIDALAAIQEKIIDNALCYVKPGGLILYCTCTLTQEENQQNFQKIESHPNFSVVLLEEPMSKKVQKYVELFPHIHGCNGFFICIFRKVTT